MCFSSLLNSALPQETLLMKLKAGSDTFKYESAYWTNTQVLNPTSTSVSENDDIDAKLPEFNSVPVSTLKLCYKTLTNCYTYKLGQIYNSARDLFSEGFLRSDNLGGGDLSKVQAKRAFTDLFLPPDDEAYDYYWTGGSGSPTCNMQRPGINTQCNDNNWARIGYCVNLPGQGCQPSDGSDADSSIGIGLKTQNWPNHVNAPFGEYFIHGRGESGIRERQSQAWIFAVESGISRFLCEQKTNKRVL